MTEHRLVMITGSGPGAGKTTLANRLQDEYAAPRLWPEKALFEWEDLAGLADRFRRRDYPDPDDLLRELTRVLELGVTWILDWAWVELAEDLPWAVDDQGALDDFSRRAHAAVAHLRPVVVYLCVDIPVALRRAVIQRGERWLARRGNFEAVAARYASRETRIRRALKAGGWSTVDIRVNADADGVFAEARTALQLVGS